MDESTTFTCTCHESRPNAHIAHSTILMHEVINKLSLVRYIQKHEGATRFTKFIDVDGKVKACCYDLNLSSCSSPWNDKEMVSDDESKLNV